MADREIIKPFQVITSGNMASATITGLVTIIQKLSMLSYQFTWSGSTPVGTLAIEVSNTYAINPDGSVKTAGTWSALTLNVGGTPASSIAISGNTGSGIVDIDAIGFYAVRPKYTKTSGTGTLQGWVTGKVA